MCSGRVRVRDVCACMCLCMHVCMHVCACVHVLAHVHTSTPPQSSEDKQRMIPSDWYYGLILSSHETLWGKTLVQLKDPDPKTEPYWVQTSEGLVGSRSAHIPWVRVRHGVWVRVRIRSPLTGGNSHLVQRDALTSLCMSLFHYIFFDLIMLLYEITYRVFFGLLFSLKHKIVCSW